MSGTGDQQDQQQDTQSDAGASAVSRPDFIPEAIWDGEKNAPKIDIAASLTELDSLRPLKTAADERAAKVPGKPEDYKFDLPADFKLPEGTKWEAKADDPLVVGFRDLAVANKWTQDEVSNAVGMYAKVEAAKIQAETARQTAFAADQTKALGANAEQRRGAAKTWMDANLSKTQAALLSTTLDFKDGVEAIEALIAKASGTRTRGNAGDGAPEDENKNLADQIGTQPMGRKLLDIANARKA